MGRRLSLLVPVLALALGACGKDIGDSCSFSTDCDPNGARLCIDPTFHGGYCTIQGCDYSTCPDNSACIRFFTGNFANITCDPVAENNPTTPSNQRVCTPDQLCSIQGHCVARSSESRYCMKTCGNNGDCRDGYECRTFTQMAAEGGEPVLAPGLQVTEKTAPKYCAVAPSN
jgi:hypothetical protein